LEADNWNIEVNGDGGGNAELQYYRKENVSTGIEPVSGNYCLILTARKEAFGDKTATSGRVNTHNKWSFKHGKIEASIKLPKTANGLWPAFWMMGNDYETVGWPQCGEIDILEMGEKTGIDNGTQNRYFNGACHWGESGENHPGHSMATTNTYDLQDGFHLYTLYWDEKEVKMYLDLDKHPDAAPYYVMNIAAGTEPAAYLHKPFCILFNLAVGGNFPQIWDIDQVTALNAENGFEAKMYVDFVKVYQRSTGNEEIVASGTSGSISWTLEKSTMTISGTGRIPYNLDWSLFREKIRTVDIKDGVTSASDGFFYYLSSIHLIKIPASFIEIDAYSLRNLNSLRSIEVAADNLNYSSEDGILYSKDKSTLIKYPVMNLNLERTFSIPDFVTSIGEEAFFGCHLDFVSIGNSVTSIGKRAFYGSGPFSFFTITIGNSVTNIGIGAFDGCRFLRSIEVAADNFHYCSESGVLYNKGKTMLIKYPNQKSVGETFTIPVSVDSIGDHAFDGSELNSVSLGSTISIGSCAFYSCSKLESIDFPPTLVEIGSASFELSGLTSVTIPASVTSIGDWAFTKCPNLKSVVFLGAVKSMGSNIFAGYWGAAKPLQVEVRSDVPFTVEYAFYEVDLQNSTLIVPAGAKANYLAADVWKDFGTIIEK
jgi:beta-glucanase (GH16 family)